jgi:hypothetical protein
MIAPKKCVALPVSQLFDTDRAVFSVAGKAALGSLAEWQVFYCSPR